MNMSHRWSLNKFPKHNGNTLYTGLFTLGREHDEGWTETQGI